MFSHFHASVRFHVSCHSTRLAQLNYHPHGLHDDICRADYQQTAFRRVSTVNLKIPEIFMKFLTSKEKDLKTKVQSYPSLAFFLYMMHLCGSY